MIEPVWINSEVQLFWCVQDSSPVWLQFVEIERIRWNDPKKARVMLRGVLPAARQLVRIADGDSLELIWNECVPPGDYWAEGVIMRFVDCTIKRKWIPTTSVSGDPGYYQPVVIYVSLECELRINV